MRPTNVTRVEATLDALSCLPNQAAATQRGQQRKNQSLSLHCALQHALIENLR